MKEFKGRVFATSNDFRDDEYGKFIFRWDDTVKKIDWFCDEIDLDKREIELNKKLDRLKKLIDKQRKYFLDNCCFL